jgi:hypothetical protein
MSHSFNDSYIDGSTIFILYDWFGYKGLIDSTGRWTATAYVFRLLCRGLQGGKQKYAITESPPENVEWLAAVDQPTQTMYVTFKNHGAGAENRSITLDVTAIATEGSVTYYQFSEGINDEVIGKDVLKNGVVAFTLPKSSFFQVVIPLGSPPGQNLQDAPSR